jgi:hypothetical protein
MAVSSGEALCIFVGYERAEIMAIHALGEGSICLAHQTMERVPLPKKTSKPTTELDISQFTGPEEELKPLCQRLKDENVFVREVDTLGIAYHSPALEPFSGVLAKELETLLPNPKARSKTWLSTSYPLDSTDPQAGICGPEYHVRHLLGALHWFHLQSLCSGVGNG